MKRIKYNIPNAITTLNCVCGVAAIFAATRGITPLWCGLSGLYWACIFIGLSAVADYMDGFAARALNAYSNLGKELDSLCDLVSFGVAPAMVMFQALGGASEWIAWCMLLVPACGALRLAKYNIDDRQATEFIGLPIPANAIFWIGYLGLYLELQMLIPAWVTLIAIVCISYLMVGNLRLYSLKFHGWGFKENVMRYCLILAAILFVVSSGLRGLLWLILYYIVSGAALNMRSRG